MWIRFEQIYGEGLWSKKYGILPSDPWKEILCDLKPSEIRSGYNLMVKSKSEFPPNAKAFRNLCRKETNPIHHDYNAIGVIDPRDPESPGYEKYKEVKNTELNKINNILKGIKEL